jgi:uncharacterized protein YuzE
MTIRFDPRRNIAYVRFQPRSGQVDSIKICDQLVVDMAPDGTVYGIELLNANEQLKTGDAGKFILINEETGVRVDIPFTIP